MLVVSSNWALTDGTLVRPSTAWLAGLSAAIHRAAIRAGFGRDGGYRPIEGVDVVLAGDTFDWLLSAEWRGRIRPWHGGAAARAAVERVAWRSVRRGRRVLGPLARWARHGLAVPTADRRDRPGHATTAVPVRVTLLAGDRDAALVDVARPGSRAPFSAGVVWEGDGISIRHGHECDPACRQLADGPVDRTGRPPTLAESVAVDLVVPFLAELGGAAAEPTVARLIREIASAHPAGIPAAIRSWRDVDGGNAYRGVDRLASTWRRCISAWLAAARRHAPTCDVEFDALPALAAACDEAFAMTDDAPAIPAATWRLETGLRPRPLPAGRSLILGHVAGGPNDGRPPAGGGRPAAIARSGQRTDAPWETLAEPGRRPVAIAVVGRGDAGTGFVDAA